MIQETRTALEKRIKEKAKSIKDLVGRDVLILDEVHADAIAQDLGLTLLDVFRATLGLGIYPRRYL